MRRCVSKHAANRAHPCGHLHRPSSGFAGTLACTAPSMRPNHARFASRVRLERSRWNRPRISFILGNAIRLRDALPMSGFLRSVSLKWFSASHKIKAARGLLDKKLPAAVRSSLPHAAFLASAASLPSSNPGRTVQHHRAHVPPGWPTSGRARSPGTVGALGHQVIVDTAPTRATMSSRDGGESAARR